MSDPIVSDKAVDPVVDQTLAAYALNLLYGAELQDFERENVLNLAERAGATVNASHQALALARLNRNMALETKLSERDTLRAALLRCAQQFRRYAELHALKPDGTGQEKAKVNAEFAAMCEQALGMHP